MLQKIIAQLPRMKSLELDIDKVLKTLARLDEKSKEIDEAVGAIRSEILELFWDLIELKRKKNKNEI